MKPAKPRYYVHGDQHETEPDKYYCKSCGLFMDSEHFIRYGSCNDINHYKRYEQGMKAWRTMKKNGTSYRRPTKTRNLAE